VLHLPSDSESQCAQKQDSDDDSESYEAGWRGGGAVT
jgi:hypothetical protein